MYRQVGEASEGWITDIDDYVDDANISHSSPLPLYLPIINIKDNQDAPKDKSKNYLPGFISNPFILFWSIYYSSYANNKQNNNMANNLSDLELFAMELTHTVEMFPSNQTVAFYGIFAPVELSLEEFAEKYKDFILKRYANQSL